MSDSRDFRNAESVCSSGPTHFPTLFQRCKVLFRAIVDWLAATRASDRTHEIYLIYLETFFGKLSCDGGINNIYADEFAAWKTSCLHSSRIQVQNSGKPCHARDKEWFLWRTPYQRRDSCVSFQTGILHLVPMEFILETLWLIVKQFRSRTCIFLHISYVIYLFVLEGKIQDRSTLPPEI